MRYTLIFLTLLVACQPSELEEKQQTLELSYIQWTCACPSWVEQGDIDRFGHYDNIYDSLPHYSIYVLPADSSLKLPDSIGRAGDIIRFTGNFYRERGVPKDYANGKQARMFNYTKYEIVSRDYSMYWPITDTVIINSVSAVVYAADSARKEERMRKAGEENFRMGMDDYASSLNDAAEYLDEVK